MSKEYIFVCMYVRNSGCNCFLYLTTQVTVGGIYRFVMNYPMREGQTNLPLAKLAPIYYHQPSFDFSKKLYSARCIFFFIRVFS